MYILDRIYSISTIIFLLYFLVFCILKKIIKQPILKLFFMIVISINIISYILIHTQIFIGNGYKFDLTKEVGNLLYTTIACYVLFLELKYKNRNMNR